MTRAIARLSRLPRGTGATLVALAATLAYAVSAHAPQAPPIATISTGAVAAPRDDSGRVREGSFWSQALGTRKRYLVYLPPSYDASGERRYPVLFYLHGMWGSENDWVKAGRLDATLDSLARTGAPEAIVVMPDGDDGWYTTWNFLGDFAACRRAPPATRERVETYCVPWPKYDEYVARDLVAFVDSTYRTIAAREARGIAGLSMGGYGAVTLALRYPAVFAAAASHSGVLAPSYAGSVPFRPPPRYATAVDSLRTRFSPSLWPHLLRAFGHDTAGWVAREPWRLARRLKESGGPMPALAFDIGRDDPYVEENRAFDHELRALGITHRYAEHPGAHTWTYWRAHAAESVAWLTASLRTR